jgi:DNA-binding transcriptional MerR regulator
MVTKRELFTIGAVAKARGVTKDSVSKLIKSHGINPAYIDELSGTRYFSRKQVEMIAALPRRKYHRLCHNAPENFFAKG